MVCEWPTEAGERRTTALKRKYSELLSQNADERRVLDILRNAPSNDAAGILKHLRDGRSVRYAIDSFSDVSRHLSDEQETALPDHGVPAGLPSTSVPGHDSTITRRASFHGEGGPGLPPILGTPATQASTFHAQALPSLTALG